MLFCRLKFFLKSSLDNYGLIDCLSWHPLNILFHSCSALWKPKQDNIENAVNLKTRALPRAISSDSHSVSKRFSWLLYNTWTGPAPWSVTHVNSDYIIVLTDCHTAVTHHSPAWPDTGLYLKVPSQTLDHNVRSSVPQNVVIPKKSTLHNVG